MSDYLRPDNLDEALDALSARKLTIIAGGTDHYPARVGAPLDEDLLDITAIANLREIEERANDIRIGALITWTDIVEAHLPPCFDGLKQAARAIGGRQIQNAATVVGNICNASPAADGAPNLLALDAGVALASARGERVIPLAEFITGNRQTTRAPDEMVVAITIAKPTAGAGSLFLKLGARTYLVISTVMVALVIEPDGDRVACARIAVGACAPVSRRLATLEESLVGARLDGGLGACAAASHLIGALEPIDDIRGSAAYRWDAALTLVRRGLAELGGRMGAGP